MYLCQNLLPKCGSSIRIDAGIRWGCTAVSLSRFTLGQYSAALSMHWLNMSPKHMFLYLFAFTVLAEKLFQTRESGGIQGEHDGVGVTIGNWLLGGVPCGET